MALQGLTVDIQPQTAGTQKSVRDARHAIDCRGRHPTEQYFRRLLGHRRDAQIAHLEALAREIHRLAAPGPADDFDAFLGQARAVGDLALELLELHLPIAQTDTEIEATAAEQGQGRRVLGDAHGIGDGQQHQVGAQAQGLGARRHVGADHQWRRGVAVVAKVMLRQPQGLEAHFFCRGDLRQPLGIKRLKGHAPGLWIAKVVPQPIGDFSVHGVPPAWLVRDESGWDGAG